jgi:phytoene dehydrogenase-like protein
MTSRELLEKRFRSPVTRALLGSWPMHAGRGLDAAHSALWIPLILGTLQAVGAPIVAGGVAGLADALVRMIEHHGGVLQANRSVSRILVEGGQAVGVRTKCGETFQAKRVVVASANPDQLYLKLLADTPAVSPLVRQQAENHRYNFGFVQLHLALSEPPHWKDQRLAEAGIIHITSGIDAISRGVNEATRGLLPAEPTIGLDCPSLRDPSRAPEGCAVMRIQAAETPVRIRGDAAGEIDVGDGCWTTEVKRRFADRMLQTVARHVPNLLSAIKAMEIISPAELASSNLNAGPGAISSVPLSIVDSHLFRSNHRTVVPNLFNVGAATWPGPAVSGASGYILSQTLLSDRIR